METLIDALLDVMEAKRVYDKAWSEVEYDKGYFTHYEQERLNDATKHFKEKLNELIDERIGLKKGS